jgi:hypothetical protein
MTRFNIFILFKFLVGIVLIQGSAAILAYAAFRIDQLELRLLFGALALGIGLLAAFWFTSIAAHLSKDTVVRARESFFKEREQIRLKAEREKTKVIQKSHQQIVKERNRAQNRASLRTGASFAAVLGLGALMLLTQFATIGLLTLTTAGGALGGYLFRARQERHARRSDSAGLLPPATRPIGARLLQPVRAALIRKPQEPAARTPPSPG